MRRDPAALWLFREFCGLCVDTEPSSGLWHDDGMDIVRRIKKWLVRLFVLVRKKLRGTEDKLDEVQPHPALGALVMVLGIVVAIAGLAMLVLPGPGMLALAIGIVAIIVGFKIITGQYGPNRKKRERAKKHERMARRRRTREHE